MVEDTAELIAYWTEVGQCSPHLHSRRPCITDAYCHQSVRRLLARYLDPIETPAQLKVLKLDLYNEATWTQYSRYFFERGMPVYAIDICPEIIHLSCQRVTDWGHRALLTPVQSDFRNIPFADNSFDVTFSYGSIEHVSQWRLALKEQVRVTNHGGLIFVGVPNLLNIWLKPLIQRLFERTLRMYMNREIHFPWWRIRDAVARLDVTDVQVHGVQIFPKPIRFVDLITENYLANHQDQWWIRWLSQSKRAALYPLLVVSNWVERQDGRFNLLAGDTIVVKAIKK